jgi:hypothetical protein
VGPSLRRSRNFAWHWPQSVIKVALVVAVPLRSGNQMMVLQVVSRAAGDAIIKLHGAVLAPVSMDCTDLGLNGLPRSLV